MTNKKISFWPLASFGSWLFLIIMLGGWFFGLSAVSNFLTAFGVVSAFFTKHMFIIYI